MRTHFLIAALFFFLVSGATAQNRLKIDHSASSLSILGTSTIHDWEIRVNEFNGTMTASLAGQSNDILEGTLTASVGSFESYKKSMDKVVFEAMMVDKYPKLSFQYVKTKNTFNENGHTYKVISGKLTIAGTTRDIEMTMKVNEKGKGVTLTGKKAFKMSDFNIDPPTAMFGTIKSGDEVTIDFNISFS
jgi:polyisoprenoid-binding protein YceI